MSVRPPKILVVDRSRDETAAARDVLDKLRCHVVLAHSGNEALAACLRHDFALLFLALDLPDIDGYEVAELLKEEPSTRHIPIIFVAAPDTDALRKGRGYQMGAIDFIERPVSELVLRSKATLFLDLYTSKQQLKLELARSEAMRTEARDNEARYRDAIIDAPTPMMLHADDGEVILVNRSWLELTGYSSSELASVEAWSARAFGAGGEPVCARPGPQSDIGVVHHGEHRVTTARGEVLVWDFRSAPLTLLPDGRRMILCMAQDVTAHRAALAAAAEARRKAEAADRAKGEFLANMSHEIRTPLHVIHGLGQLLRDELGEGGAAERLDRLCETSDHLLAVINDILDISKIEAHRFALDHSDFALAAVVDKVVHMVALPARDKELALATEIEPELLGLMLNGDAVRLAQVLINLCSNAVKFTERGRVSLAIRRVAQDAGSVTLRFAVDDTGIGIAPEDQHRLFRAFEQADTSATRAHGGTGLGLAISQKLVSLMGGRIELESRPGTGSRFSFELTLERGKDHAAGTAPPHGRTVFPGARVLVAEDQPLNQEIILEFLERLGCEVDVAGDGVEAVQCARSNDYDAILMDARMPRMDGLAAARAIRALPLHGRTPILAVTASAFAEDRQQCIEAGMDDHISKPFTQAALAAWLAKWLPHLAAYSRPAPPGDGDPGRLPAAAEARLRRYLAMQRDDAEQLQQYLGRADIDGACDVLHRIKGISGFLGGTRIARLAAEIEASLRAGARVDAIMPLMADWESALAEFAVSAGASNDKKDLEQ